MPDLRCDSHQPHADDVARDRQPSTNTVTIPAAPHAPLAASPSKPKLAKHTDEDIEARLGVAALPLEMFCLLCRHNSDVLRMDDNVSSLKYYHSVQEPPMKVSSYIDRIVRYSDCGVEGILIALRLAGRIHRVAGVTLTRLSAHRLLITALTVGVKAHMDIFKSNRVIADAGGLQTRELNGLEFAFFRELEYRAHVSQAEIEGMLMHATAAANAQRRGLVEEALLHARAAFIDDANLDATLLPPLRRCTSLLVPGTPMQLELSRSSPTPLATIVENSSMYTAPLETSVDLSP